METIAIYTEKETTASEECARKNLDALTNVAARFYSDQPNFMIGHHPRYIFFSPKGDVVGEMQPSACFGLTLPTHRYVCSMMEPGGFVFIKTSRGEKLYAFSQ